MHQVFAAYNNVDNEDDDTPDGTYATVSGAVQGIREYYELEYCVVDGVENKVLDVVLTSYGDRIAVEVRVLMEGDEDQEEVHEAVIDRLPFTNA